MKTRSPAPRQPSRASVASATADAATSHFMSSAPRPQTCARRPSLTAEGIALPLGGVGEHDVGVREERKRRPVAGPADAGDEVRALGHARVELTLDTGRLQVVAQELGSRGLVAGRIRGVDADEPLQQLGYFTHLRVPRTSR